MTRWLVQSIFRHDDLEMTAPLKLESRRGPTKRTMGDLFVPPCIGSYKHIKS
jgi:hypothetical protein